MKQKPIFFVQECNPYETEILICAGGNKKEVIAYAKKVKAKKEFVKWLEEDNYLYEFKEKNKGTFAWNEDEKVPGYILFLDFLKDDWTYWAVLVHEIAHIVHHIAKNKGMLGEDESKAYLQEYLFTSIRRRLQKYGDKQKSKAKGKSTGNPGKRTSRTKSRKTTKSNKK